MKLLHKKKSPIDSDCWRKCVCFPSAFLRPKFKPSNEQRLDLYIEDQMTCTIKLVIYVYKRRKVNSVLRKKMGGFLYTQNSIPFFLILCVHFPFEPDFRLLCCVPGSRIISHSNCLVIAERLSNCLLFKQLWKFPHQKSIKMSANNQLERI
jgi:hypothetical protein